ncbi:hypothetical protein ACO34A_13035 [Rhizobium sp. ACO-34A]|nr:hypothetical protein [Rhizobium sp. ACO-34A]ATN34725.1 hypothetical protein ACO34A_13035 [Rhizobium sp. ACO-34A]
MSETERAEIVDAATALHRVLADNLGRVDPVAADYGAMDALNGAIVDAIRSLTGEEPSWMRLRTGWPKS